MKDKVIKIVVYAFLVLLSLAFLFPLYLMVEMSLFTSNDVFEIPRRLFPSALTFSNYVECFTIAGYVPDEWGNPTSMPYMVVYLLNSIYVVVGNVAGTVLSSTLCSYGFAKIKFKFREPIFFAVLATMMIPGSVTMLSMFTVYKNLGMMNTRLPLWLPVWFGGGAVNIFLLRQFMRGLPNDILESASIDGARTFEKALPDRRAKLRAHPHLHRHAERDGYLERLFHALALCQRKGKMDAGAGRGKHHSDQ